MKKETIIAIVLGIFLGIFVAIFIITKTREKILETAKPISKETKITPTVSLTGVPLEAFEIIEPKEEIVVNKKNITIKGRTTKDALIVIQSPVKDLIFKNTKEEFSIDFPLSFGENTIQVTVYPKDNQLRPQEKELRIYYLDEL